MLGISERYPPLHLRCPPMPAGRPSRFRDLLSLQAVQGGGGVPVRAPQFVTRLVMLVAVPLLAALAAAAALIPLASARAAGSAGQPMSWGDPARGGPSCTTANCWTVPQPAGGPVADSAAVVSVDAENNFNLETLADGTVWAWGQGNSGQLGDGSTQSSAVPAQVQDLANVTMTGGGNSDAIALESDGTVWTWGLNNGGQLGDGQVGGHRDVPGMVSLPGAACAVDAGASRDYALLCNGTVWAWGQGALGGAAGPQASPVQVRRLAGVTEIASGNQFGYAEEANGTWWSWGYNRYGQLCDGTTSNRNAPGKVPALAGATEVSAGGNLQTDGHILALLPGGTAKACGDNADGQLGNGQAGGFSATPVTVAGLSGVTAVAAGGYHSMALDGMGNVWCWGGNDQGQVGNGTTADVDTPVEVLRGAAGMSAGSMHSLALTG
jgi:hypothetical protein